MERINKGQDPLLQIEREARMTPEDDKRYGSYTFPDSASYTGWWLRGKVSISLSLSLSLSRSCALALPHDIGGTDGG